MLVAKKVLGETFRFLDDALRALEKINKEVDDLLGLQKVYIKQTAALVLQVNIPTTKNSPKIPEEKSNNINFVSIEKLRKNYTVVKDLWDTRESLEAMEVKIRQSFASKDGVNVNPAIAEIAKLKKRVELGLSEAFTFLKGLADKNLPEKFATFNRAVFSILERSIAYETATSYSYVFEVDGDICFSTYIQLARVTDDDGTYYPELYVVTTYRTGVNASNFIAILPKFVPPSSRLLMKKVSTIKETVRALNMLLALDNFSSSIGSLPVSLLLKSPTVDKSLFLYQEHILSIRVDEEQIVFTLKPTVTEKSLADKIISQIFIDFQGIVRKTNAKVRMAVKKAKKCFVLTFSFVTQNESPMITEDDLSFLKVRFNIEDHTLKEVVKTINSGSSL